MPMSRSDEEQRAASALVVRHLPERPRAAVLTLHGGRPESLEAARPWHLAALRMRPVLRAAALALSLDEVVLGQVRYRHRGWNGGDPAQDAFRALSELGRLVGEVPVVLVGHSMGGRAALRAAARPGVRGVLALAPWLPEGEPTSHLGRARVVVLHGDRDRVTSAASSADFVRRARSSGARAGAVLIGGGDHAMVRRSGLWHRSTAGVVAELLEPGQRPGGLAAESFTAAGALVL
ncbi:alpha/beta fold hydrolase [Streptomyces naganishii]|uniref:Alpha/beta hydrolase n=1 Tax=Streptomyces naganishii JCM 4654 TaxID=1306179 RepID=A0A918Y741_9ACTN|nr:alpha/beta fold hydrolase [Streptomyces naganishii]GHD93426.1 alpha/beta hydrolase [Streptomyces naganishii JCM 4654]